MTTKLPRVPAVPTAWLMTDARLGGEADSDPLWRAIARLPEGAGIVFRHQHLAPEDRLALYRRVAEVAELRGLILVAAGFEGANGRHYSAAAVRRAVRTSGRRFRTGLTTASAHSRREMCAAVCSGADLIFLSPVFATRSHPGTTPLGPLRFGLLARSCPVPVIALGGMTPARCKRLRPLGAAGFAAIDWWVQ